MNQRPNPLRGTAPLWLGVAALQVLVAAALAVVWSGDVDSTATTVDWALVALILGTPVALAVSYAVGWWLRRRQPAPGSRAVRCLAGVGHWGTLAVLVPASVFALPLAAMAVFVEPMG